MSFERDFSIDEYVLRLSLGVYVYVYLYVRVCDMFNPDCSTHALPICSNLYAMLNPGAVTSFCLSYVPANRTLRSVFHDKALFRLPVVIMKPLRVPSGILPSILCCIFRSPLPQNPIQIGFPTIEVYV